MFATLHPDPQGQELLAVEASSKPPIFNRPPHVVCQLCRSKKLRCSGYNANGCVRCRDSYVECLPVERSRRESRSSHKVTKARSEASKQNTNSQSTSTTGDNTMSSFANMDIPDLDLPRSVSMSGSPEVSSVFSPNTSWDGLSGSSSFTHDNLSHHLYTGDTLAAKDDIPISEALLLPTTGIDIASSGDSIQNPANFEYGTSYVESKLPCHANEQNSSSDLRWQEMFDRMIQSSGSAPRDCQCLDRALELLDGLFVQHGNSANPLSTFKSKYHQTSDAMQKLSFLRMELNAFEGIASCAQCKKTRCLMGLLVLLSERLSTLFRQIFEIMPLSTFQAGIDFENTSSPMPSNEDLSNIGEKEIQPREYETGSHFRTKTEERNTKMILSCNGFTLDMSKETEALLLHLALLAMQQLRKVIATLWGRAQDEQRKDLSENLSQCGQRLHSMNAVLKEILTNKYA